MRTIKESILSSTGTGMLGSIQEWIKKFPTNSDIFEKGNSVSAEIIGGKSYVVVDNEYGCLFLIIGRSLFECMPSVLNGILVRDKDGRFHVPEIEFISLLKNTVDLSHWDYTPALINPNEIQILFANCSLINVVGLPKYSISYTVSEISSSFNKVTVKDMKLNWTVGACYDHAVLYGGALTSMQDCQFASMTVCRSTFKSSGVRLNRGHNYALCYEYKERKHVKLPLYKEYSDVIDKFLSNNKVTTMYYRTNKDTDSAPVWHKQTRLLNKYDGCWCIENSK